MDEKARIRENLQLQVNQALTTVKELLRRVAEQWEVMAEAGCKLADLDAQDGTYNAVADAAAQLD